MSSASAGWAQAPVKWPVQKPGLSVGATRQRAPGLDQLLGKPEVAVLIAQGHMRPLDRHHALCVKALADADLDLHGIGCALAIFALQHGFLFIVENHVFPSCFLLDGHFE